MDSIFDLARKSIEMGGFDLSDKLREITSIMLVGQINPYEYDELAALAQRYANAEAEPNESNILGALRTINAELNDIKKRLAALEKTSDENTEEEYPAWERWNGLPTSGYQFGDKVSHNGVKYVSNYIGINVWEPGLIGTELLWTVLK